MAGLNFGEQVTGDTLKLRIAIAELKWNPEPYQPKDDFGIYDKNYVLRTQFSDHTTYWYGHPEGDVYAPRPPVPTSVSFDAAYTTAQRRRTTSMEVKVTSVIPTKLQ